MQLIWIAGPSGRMRSWTLRRAHVLWALAFALLLPLGVAMGGLVVPWLGGQAQVELQVQQQERLHDINSKLAQMVAQVQVLEQQKNDLARMLGARTSPQEAPMGKSGLRFQGGPFKLLMGEDRERDPWAYTGHEIDSHVAWAKRLSSEWQREQVSLQRMPLAWPLTHDFEISSEFGARQDPFTGVGALHEGLDFVAPAGTPVQATAAGRVVHAGPTGAYGQMIEIDHGQGYTTRYAHLRKLVVREGEKIEKGAVVGELGNTGRSTGAHLHYEIRHLGRAIDPETPLVAWNR
jgi:murein DD-endopeptidase MepM/ murein hydrolase activator NlpD